MSKRIIFILGIYVVMTIFCGCADDNTGEDSQQKGVRIWWIDSYDWHSEKSYFVDSVVVKLRIVPDSMNPVFQYCYLRIHGNNTSGTPEDHCVGPIGFDKPDIGGVYEVGENIVFRNITNLPPGKYKVEAYIATTSTESDCAQFSFVKFQAQDPLYVGVADSANVMHIQYDCMMDWDISGSGWVDHARSVLIDCSIDNLDLLVIPDDINVLDESLDDKRAFDIWLDIYWLYKFHNNQQEQTMYLASIYNILDLYGIVSDIGAIGFTSPVPLHSKPGSYSIILTGKIDAVFTCDPYNYTTDAQVNSIIKRVCVHELGHQRAGLRHVFSFPGDHNDDCIMDSMYFDTNFNVLTDHDNFCRDCCSILSQFNY